MTDDQDTCANTLSGEVVDANGCSDSQKDTDGDGVTDNQDICPDTPAGTDVNADGCSVIYLAENGITIKAKDVAQVGLLYSFNGKSYRIVDNTNIKSYLNDTAPSEFDYLVTTKVTDMYALFYNNTASDINISSWDVSNVESMEYLFDNAQNFNGDISSWDVSNVNNMRGMFKRAYKFNQDLSGWDVSSVTVCSDFKLDANSFVLSIPNFTFCNPN